MKKALSLVVSIILTLIVFSFSLVSGETSGNQSLLIAELMKSVFEGLFPNWEPSLALLNQFIRKGAHVAEFLLIGVSWLITFRLYRIRLFLFPLLGAMIALSDEGIQLIAINRGASLVDALVFDFSGFILGGVIVYFLTNPKIKRLTG